MFNNQPVMWKRWLAILLMGWPVVGLIGILAFALGMKVVLLVIVIPVVVIASLVASELLWDGSL
jgi:hypothetical protein